MHFRKIKRKLTEVYINEPLETNSEGNTLTIADILSSGVNIEEETELRINSQKLYKFIAEKLDDREREIICKPGSETDEAAREKRSHSVRSRRSWVSRAVIFRGSRKRRWRSSGGGLRRGRGYPVCCVICHA